MSASAPLRIGVLGAGGRGREAYGSWVLRHPERTRLVAVADPDPDRRGEFAGRASGAREYEDWTALVGDLEELALDAAIVALPDRLHVEPAIALMAHSVPILLEKPAASRADELEQLAGAVERLGGRVVVGHVLRFTPFWRSVASVVFSGAIGRLMTVDLRENIGFWHFAHSYVRGNWKRSADSSPMVLAKTCHDLDIIRWLAGEAPTSVFSVGELSYFRPENAPAGAPEFCIQGCPVADSCPFYAPRYYAEALHEVHGVPVTLLTADTSPEGRREALGRSDYGRCVFRSGNDVADHQQTALGFPSGMTATLTASAFTGDNSRHVSLTGTAGQIIGHMDEGRIEIDLFSPLGTLPELPLASLVEERTRPPLGHRSVVLTARPPGVAAGDHRGHAGGDDGLMEEFVNALETGVWSDDLAFSTALDSHRIAFAAEDSRRAGRPTARAGTVVA